ncbi:unnamed protein product [Darwinula stevensoni]|uniref:Uncharacterized protein n=1 Tax=Darwinula stevensoni TaxID=69355 RepID=A0A7R9AAB9_9CRUS|nr:unnamed protein product [Darwinula stevensoni]CAG0898263.1 unnamed protein product [Darwinula stevensoni]
MILSLIFLSGILALVSGQTEQECPTEDIHPCTCTKYSKGEVRVDCSRARSGAQIASVFKNAYWPSRMLWQFVIMDNAEVQELPEGVFRDLSFQDIWVNYTALRRIHPAALLPSKDSLQTMTILFSDLDSFPLDMLPLFSRLKELSLRNNSLTSVPAIESDSLEILNLPYNNLAKVEGLGWRTPNLREFYISLTPDTTVILSWNKVEVLDETIIRPILEVMTQGEGCLYLESTAKTRGSTANGMTNGAVKANGKKKDEVCLCPQNGGYSCVEAKEANCNPGTFILNACPKNTQLQSTTNGQLFLVQSMGFPSSPDKEELERRIRGNVLKEAKRGSAGFSVEIRS